MLDTTVFSRPVLSDLLADDHAFTTMPRRLTSEDSWHGHIPFAFWLVRRLEPRLTVELGVGAGDSFSAFCQAIDDLGIEGTVRGIDHWSDAPTAPGCPSPIDAYRALFLHVETEYGRFAKILRKRFEEAVAEFEDGSIDLLHLDGPTDYDTARREFDLWRPKLSDRAVVLLHDTIVSDADHGVWKLFEELSAEHQGRSFSFEHSQGLGMVALGRDAPAGVIALGGLSDAETAAVRFLFGAFGRLVRYEGLADHAFRRAGGLVDPVGFSARTDERDEFGLRRVIDHIQDKAEREEARATAFETELRRLHAVPEEIAPVRKARRDPSVQDALDEVSTSWLWRLFFRKTGKPKTPFRQIMFQKSGKPRGLTKRMVLKKKGYPRPAFRPWMNSDAYRQLPGAVIVTTPSK